MREVLAGFMVGYILSFAMAPIVALALVRMRVGSPALARLVPETVPLAALAVALYWFSFMAWTAVGAGFGLLLQALEEASPRGGLGSPNFAFTLLTVALTAMIAIPPFFILPAARRQVLLAAAVCAGSFGWLLPHMAGWARFGGD